ncbi:hypothetical protein MmTuc01_1307 [Methanosarcina mazei Tuc01]|uniref:Uncharacterized protein n=1 Tax=Methanosarcina mazei Tuc01 TaxID=1236903 RepID=M1Q907_METMZ|nr:hypothetical protein MmTuc01_1307 [Methanosarcina mazei Tuc01]
MHIINNIFFLFQSFYIISKNSKKVKLHEMKKMYIKSRIEANIIKKLRNSRINTR